MIGGCGRERGFLYAGYAGLAATSGAAIVPALLARKSRSALVARNSRLGR